MYDPNDKDAVWKLILCHTMVVCGVRRTGSAQAVNKGKTGTKPHSTEV